MARVYDIIKEEQKNCYNNIGGFSRCLGGWILVNRNASNSANFRTFEDLEAALDRLIADGETLMVQYLNKGQYYERKTAKGIIAQLKKKK